MQLAHIQPCQIVQNAESTVECLTSDIQPCYHSGTASDTAHSRTPQTEYPDRRRKDTMDDTTAKELDRLADWLRAQGMTPAQVLDCLKYIAGTTPPTASAGK